MDGVHQVELLEDHIVLDLRRHLIHLAPRWLEIVPLPVGGYGVRQLVDPAFGLVQGVQRDIRGKQAGVPGRGLAAQVVHYVHGDIVRLLPRGAGRAPDGQALVPLMLAHNLRQNGAGKVVEALHLAHKIGIIGGQPGEQLIHIIACALFQQIVHILGKPVKAHALHRAGEPAVYQLPLLVQVQAVFALYKIYQPGKILFAYGHGGSGPSLGAFVGQHISARSSAGCSPAPSASCRCPAGCTCP